MKELDIAVKTNTPALLIGPTGSGKTTMIRELAKTKNKKLVRFSITGDTTVDEFIGKYELIDGNTVWQDGVLLNAMKQGDWIVLDELNMAGGDILSALHSLLDDDNFVTVTAKDGEIVRPKASFRLFATMNPSEGVEGASYSGTKSLNAAFVSRFGVVIYTSYLSRAEETKLLVDNMGVTEAVASGMVDVASALRLKQSVGELVFNCSTRDLLHWARLVKAGLNETDAFANAISNKAGAERELVVQIAAEENEKIRRVLDRAGSQVGVTTVEQIEKKIAELIALQNNIVRLEAAVRQKIVSEFADRQKHLDEREKVLNEHDTLLNSKVKQAYDNGYKDAQDKFKALLEA